LRKKIKEIIADYGAPEEIEKFLINSGNVYTIGETYKEYINE